MLFLWEILITQGLQKCSYAYIACGYSLIIVDSI